MTVRMEYKWRRDLQWPAVRGQRVLDAALDPPHDYGLETCTTTPGHVAIVLRLKNDKQRSTAGTAQDTPRVVFVLDAVPPSKPVANEPLSGGFAGLRTTGQTAVDELRIVQELFATSKIGKEGVVIAKSPLLCARFDCPIVSLRFIQSSPSSNSNTKTSSSSLRCLVARQDGLAYIWEWSSDLYQWTYLNKLSFLSNPNLRWTRPVEMFTTTTDRPFAGDALELSWWSRESRAEPKLCFRQVHFDQDPTTFRTEISVGAAFSTDVTNVKHLESSSIGLWIVSASSGIHFRGAGSLRIISLPWKHVLETPKYDPSLFFCAHNVTGELLIISPATGHVTIVQLKRAERLLQAESLLSLKEWQRKTSGSILSVKAHRHMLLVLYATRLGVYSLATGDRLTCLDLPSSSPETPWSLLTTTGCASTAAVFSPTTFSFLQTPPAKDLAKHHEQKLQNTSAAFSVIHSYGPSGKFETSKYALQGMQESNGNVPEPIQQVATESIVSPALFLSSDSSAASQWQLADDMSRLVLYIYRIAHDILVTGRIGSSLDKGSAKTTTGVQHLTPANLETLHRLADWIYLSRQQQAQLNTKNYVESLEAGNDRNVELSFSPVEADFKGDLRLRNISSLDFSSGVLSPEHADRWLAQLEMALLGDSTFKHSHKANGIHAPSPLLFHDERVLADFHGTVSSFSKQMYMESLSRLYLLKEPEHLVQFVQHMASRSPRLFNLLKKAPLTRSYSERALLLLPPPSKLAEAPDGKNVNQLLAYADLLCNCGFFLEASHELLRWDLYEQCRDRFLLDKDANAFRRAKTERKEEVQGTVYIELLKYCLLHRDEMALQELLPRRPSQVTPLQVVQTLRTCLNQMEKKSQAEPNKVSVRTVRSALLTMLKASS